MSAEQSPEPLEEVVDGMWRLENMDTDEAAYPFRLRNVDSGMRLVFDSVDFYGQLIGFDKAGTDVATFDFHGLPTDIVRVLKDRFDDRKFA